MGQRLFLTLQCSGAKPSCLAMLLHTSLLGTPEHTGTRLWASRFPPPTIPPSASCKPLMVQMHYVPSLPGSCPCSVWTPAPRPAAGASAAPGQSRVTDRLGLCSQQSHNTRAMLCTLGNAGGGSDWNGQTIVQPRICRRP